MRRTKESIKKGDFLFHTSDMDYQICCVYKLHFPDAYFYIGHTACLKSRITGHKTYLASASIKHGYKNKLLNAELLCIEILEVCANTLDASQIESDEIKKIWGNHKLVNAAVAYPKPFLFERNNMGRTWDENPDLAQSIENKFGINEKAYGHRIVVHGSRIKNAKSCEPCKVFNLVGIAPRIIYTREKKRPFRRSWPAF